MTKEWLALGVFAVLKSRRLHFQHVVVTWRKIGNVPAIGVGEDRLVNIAYQRNGNIGKHDFNSILDPVIIHIQIDGAANEADASGDDRQGVCRRGTCVAILVRGGNRYR